ncbi:LINE-1 retrotransposable element ORF1 protein [Anabarilius grahami]|uniref:LINE-1 retrotransposable element ORF1 protein n=1 Tax=Anabarilius grahami TaxID=495550 RepID=A0A3N0Z0Y7_ANAGA|nr:LINE-1 retrotransposable element ORF1 protein [Anabarilius grahami]
MNKLQPQFDVLKLGLKDCNEKLVDVESGLSGMHDRMDEAERVCKALQKENKELRDKNEKLESYSRRFNLRVFGLDKDMEKGKPTEFMESLFSEIFKDKLSYKLEVEIAHRVGPVTKHGSRPMIVRMQRYVAKEAILQIAKQEKVLHFKGMKVKIFPDLTAEVSKRRAQFKDLRMKLHQAGVKHVLIYPATLIITFNGDIKYFQDQKSGEIYYNQMIGPTLSGNQVDQ